MIKHWPTGRVDLITVATHVGPGLPQFLESCRRVGVHPNMLGWGEKWSGFAMKLRLAHQHMLSTRSRHIMMLDSFDSVLLGGHSELLDKYLSIRSPMVMSAQMGCWPDPERASEYPPAPTPYATVNTGAWIGERSHILDLFRRWPIPDGPVDDQRYFTDVYLADPSAFTLDHKQELFSTCGDANLSWDGGVFNTITGGRPLVCHGNGRLSMSKIYAWANLEWSRAAAEA